MRRRLAALLCASAALSACQTTQELSAERAKAATKLAREQGLRIDRVNPDVKVARTALVRDANGAAVVLELRNGGQVAQANLPVAVAVTDARGKALYRNDAPGLEASLVSLSLLERGGEAFWVNNQVSVGKGAAKVEAQVGVAKGEPPANVPRLTIADAKLGEDNDGSYVEGTIVNHSKVVQTRLVIACVARRGGKVVAAGRAIVDRLPAAGAEPTTFTIFFIGNPKGAKLAFSAPPTVLR